ncbi:hypothetical protein E3N88_19850 [Mikania micrantha]|uniref:Bifunctional inhibitor/plant lipid transfer protein/seed storage helical domain-containing protein n=1 Tax=Mikania micrantha TaxID=192012 RepID=A0A5N6NQ17_9ASTR|nr:hypothetical protein E3N88_19850 [Mikania micrantha]
MASELVETAIAQDINGSSQSPKQRRNFTSSLVTESKRENIDGMTEMISDWALRKYNRYKIHGLHPDGFKRRPEVETDGFKRRLVVVTFDNHERRGRGGDRERREEEKMRMKFVCVLVLVMSMHMAMVASKGYQELVECHSQDIQHCPCWEFGAPSPLCCQQLDAHKNCYCLYVRQCPAIKQVLDYCKIDLVVGCPS